MSTKRIILTTLSVIGGVAVIAGAVFGYRYYDTTVNYVSTDNAQVAGDVVQISSSNPGRVGSLSVEVGDLVREGQTVGTVDVSVASSLGLTSTAGPVQGSIVTSELVSPVSGVVVGKRTVAGNQVNAGQPVLTVVDLGRLWVTANVDENSIDKVNIGQPVDVHVDMLDKTFKGHVIGITPATAGTFLANQPNNTTSDYTKVTQLVPVKIAIDYAGSMLFPGASAEVTIKVG